jgi:hypothetical protein
MSQFKYLITISLAISGLASFAQSSDAVFMKWKIKPGDSIVYKTIMDEVDTAKTNFSIGGMAKSMGNDIRIIKVLLMLKCMASPTKMIRQILQISPATTSKILML